MGYLVASHTLPHFTLCKFDQVGKCLVYKLSLDMFLLDSTCYRVKKYDKFLLGMVKCDNQFTSHIFYDLHQT